MLFKFATVLLLPLLSLAAPAAVVEDAVSEGLSARAVSAADRTAYLNAHNNERAKHGAAALTWSTTLEAAAQKWANKCVFQHSGGSLGPYGENLAAGTGSFSIAAGMKLWTDEASSYNPSSPQPSHWTQVVWKGTTQVGCAVASCDGIFDPS
jgi:pathogenesis-related protein 1